MTKTVGDLQIDQDLGFQRWEWRTERAGWALLALFVLAALLGVVGGYGPLRTGAVTAEEGLRLEYDRFVRYRAPAELRFLAPPELVSGDELVIALASDYADEVEVTSVSPQPDTVTKTGDRTLYAFKASGDGGPVTVVFRLEVARIGILRGEAGSRELSLPFTQVVYP